MSSDFPRGALKAATEALGGDEDAARRVLAAVVPLVERSAVKEAAKRILLLDALASGWRCPACHGKAATPNLRDRRTGYTCGCGHAWDPPGPRDRDYGTEPRYILARLARGIPLPDLPPKTKKESGG